VLLDGSPAAHRAVRHVLERAKRDRRLEVVLIGLEPGLLHRLPPALARLVIPGRLTAAGRTREARALFEMHRVPCRIAGASGAPAVAVAEVMHAHRCNEIVIARHDRAFVHPSALAARCGRRVTVV
jgi:hypothetical protein